MQYDPIKRSLGKVFNASPFLRICFYKMLDILLLRSWHIRRQLKRWNKLRKGEPASIIDAGSGFGQYTYRMAKLNNKHQILGVDVKSEQIADCNDFFTKLKMNNRVHFEEHDLTTFSSPNTYDLILSVDVMEHILEDRKVFDNFFESLHKGGTLLISTPSDQGGSDSDEHSDNKVHGFIDEHVRDGYNIDDIKEKLTTAGFSMVEASYTYGTPGHISWILSMKWPISILNVSKLFFVIIPIYYILFFPWCLLLNMFDLNCTHKRGTGLLVKAIK